MAPLAAMHKGTAIVSKNHFQARTGGLPTIGHLSTKGSSVVLWEVHLMNRWRRVQRIATPVGWAQDVLMMDTTDAMEASRTICCSRGLGLFVMKQNPKLLFVVELYDSPQRLYVKHVVSRWFCPSVCLVQLMHASSRFAKRPSNIQVP